MTKQKWAVFLTVMLVAVFMFSGCAIDTTYPGTMNVAEADMVGAVYQGNSDVLVIDARGQEAYAKGHLQGAIELSPSELVDENAMLISKADFESVVGKKGITNDMTLYVYDDNDGVNSGRILWSFRVYGHENIMIVNGGASALVKAGLTITKDAPQIEAVTYQAKEADQSIVATYDEVKAQTEMETPTAKILDVRSIAEYEAGFIKDAILYPHTKNLYSDGTFMSSRDLGLFYADLGIKKDDEIILYCKSSFRATQTFALLQEAGYQNVKVYDGAWLEWSTKSDVTVPVVPSVPVTEQEGS